MQKIVTDVTYIKYWGKWHYLVACLDLYKNKILEWKLSDTFDNSLVIKPARKLLGDGLRDTLRIQFRYWEQDNLHDVVTQATYYFSNISMMRKLNMKPPVPFLIELVA